jgi:P-type E1-E2 ATPase
LNLIIVIAASDLKFNPGPTMLKIAHIFVMAICILIVTIPEGMPLALSLSMALSIDRLKEDQIQIKNLDAIEQCASLNEVCIGKTGIVTENEMTVAKLIIPNRKQIIDCDPHKNQILSNLNLDEKYFDQIKYAIIGGSDAFMDVSDTLDEDSQPCWEPKGNTIDRALI